MLETSSVGKRAGTPHATLICKQTVILGDCTAELKRMPAESIDVVVTSPPYNIGVPYNSYRDKQPRNLYLARINHVAIEIRRVLRPEGSFFLNVGGTNSDPWIALEVAAVVRRHFVLQNHIVWAKSVSIGHDTIGHFKPITSNRYLNNIHESIFHFTKKGDVELDRLAVGVPFKDKSNIKRWGHERDKRCAGNVWLIPYETVRSKTQKFDHPAGFPVGLPEKCIRLHGLTKGLTVLDPFLGTGSTLEAAAVLDCRGIGIEIDPQYAKTAVDRIKLLV